ncbi:MAG: DUF1874 domain-containing protein [Desulfurococcales archaeon]|nr:DUF1874 domain-containing protein [Desulfurococcales archaeon]
MGRVVLANAISPSMFLSRPNESVWIVMRQVTVTEASKLAVMADDCAIGHPGTVELVKKLFNVSIPCERKTIKLGVGDELLIITLNFRPPEGKVYSYDELLELYSQGKISFYHVKVDSKAYYKGESRTVLIPTILVPKR